MKETEAVANRLVALCREGRMIEAQTELMSPDCEQIEPDRAVEPSVTGLAAILAKEARFTAALESMHAITISEPLVAGKFFTIRLQFDLTIKGRKRMILDELGVYEVRNGKIVREQFFY